MTQIHAQHLAFLVLDDESEEGWWRSLDPALLSDPRLVLAAGRFGSPAQARNALLDLVDQQFPNARWLARMDADDRFAEAGSLQALVEAGDASKSLYVVGSNRLRVDGALLDHVNWADAEVLLDRGRLNAFVQAFCRQEVPTELPSCNLLLRVRSGIRYPNASSAEDHWLLAGLLMHRPQQGCVVTKPAYAVYSLGGAATEANRRSQAWAQSRLALAQATDAWYSTHQIPGATVLGWGQEGVVWRELGDIYKRFYPSGLTTDDLLRIKRLTDQAGDAVVTFDVCEGTGLGARIQLAAAPLQEVGKRWPLGLTRSFLLKLYRAGVVTCNIKRDNLRFTSTGALQYIDIGRDIVSLTASRFLDCAARLYAIGELGWSDQEMARRRTRERQAEALEALPGFAAFYASLIRSMHAGCELAAFNDAPLFEPPDHADVTLLIKCCPQDASTVEVQVRHITSELGLRARFSKTVLLVDPFKGPYLRQYDEGNLSLLMEAVDGLSRLGTIDEAWWAPLDSAEVGEVNGRWFDAPDAMASHTVHGAPVTAQVWAFDRVETPYVLQMDVDILIGGTDAFHDVIADMKRACAEPGVWCVGFNIPQSRSGFKPYAGEPEEFAPEVRCGLLNLARIRANAPFENPLVAGRLSWMWHQALKRTQPKLGMRSLRGGDSRTYYMHPKNEIKGSELIGRARDLVGQGCVPDAQRDAWDLVPSLAWQYARRSEDIVVLMFGKDTLANKLERSLASLRSQTCQEFGVVFIDDGSCSHRAAELPYRLGIPREQLTLIRRPYRVGYMANFRESIERICENPEALLVVLDQDDALMNPETIGTLRDAWCAGADLINAPMFRPDKPLTLYEVGYEAVRQCGGGNVWSHLRAFRKSLFMSVPSRCWEQAPDPDCLSDFLTMVPMAELAQCPVFLDGPYLYWHERSQYPAERKTRERAVKSWLFRQAPLVPVPRG